MFDGEIFPAPNPMHQLEVVRAFSGYDVGPFEAEAKTGALHDAVKDILAGNNIDVIDSSFRAKSPASIRNKVAGAGLPLLDLY